MVNVKGHAAHCRMASLIITVRQQQERQLRQRQQQDNNDNNYEYQNNGETACFRLFAVYLVGFFPRAITGNMHRKETGFRFIYFLRFFRGDFNVNVYERSTLKLMPTARCRMPNVIETYLVYQVYTPGISLLCS